MIGKYKFPFKGIARCGYCGCAITAEIQKSRYVYYRCTNGRGKCQLRYFREEEIDDIFKEAVEALQLDPITVKWVKRAIVESDRQRREFVSNELHRLKVEYSRNETKKEQMYEDKLSGVISEDFFKDRFNSIEVRQVEIQEEIEHLEGQEQHTADDNLKTFEQIKNLNFQYDRADFENRARMLRVILSNCELTNEKCSFSYSSPFDVLAEFAKMQSGWEAGIRTPIP